MGRSAARGRAAVGAGIAAWLLVGCAAQASLEDPVPEYVDEAVAVLENGLYADSAEWEAAVERIRPELYRQSTIADTYRGITELAEIAGGRHTLFFTPDEWAADTQMSDPGTAFPIPKVSTDAGISTLPIATNVINYAPHTRPILVRNRFAVLVTQVDGIEQFAIDIELDLFYRIIADAYRHSTTITRKMIKYALLVRDTAIKCIHDAQHTSLARFRSPLAKPAIECRRLSLVTQPHQGVHAE